MVLTGLLLPRVIDLASKFGETWVSPTTASTLLSVPAKQGAVPHAEDKCMDLTSIAALQKQFGYSNILNNLRNQYAFHHPYNAEVETAFATAAGNSEFDVEWNWYLTKENINCLYFISDMIVVHGMLNAIGEEDLIGAQKKMHEQLNVAAEELIRFAQDFFDAPLTKYFSPEIIAEVVEKISDAPVAFAVNLPFYVEPPDESRLTPEGTLKPPVAGTSSR
jgi:hypothetical protein